MEITNAIPKTQFVSVQNAPTCDLTGEKCSGLNHDLTLTQTYLLKWIHFHTALSQLLSTCKILKSSFSQHGQERPLNKHRQHCVCSSANWSSVEVAAGRGVFTLWTELSDNTALKFSVDCEWRPRARRRKTPLIASFQQRRTTTDEKDKCHQSTAQDFNSHYHRDALWTANHCLQTLNRIQPQLSEQMLTFLLSRMLHQTFNCRVLSDQDPIIC